MYTFTYDCSLQWITLIILLITHCVSAAAAADDDDDTQTNSFGISATVALGIALGIFGGFIDNVGVCLQKMSHSTSDQYKAKLKWFIGISLYLFGNGINAVGLAMTPQSIFAALGSLGLVTNAVNSRLILKETLNVTIILGTVVIFIGSSLAIFFGSRSKNSDLSLDQLIDYFLASAFLGFMIVVGSTICILLMLIKILTKSNSQRGIVTGFLSVAYPLAAGMVGSFTALFAKSAIDLLLGDEGLTHISSYVALLGVAIPGAFQIQLLNKGLKRYDQLLIVPCFAVSLELFTICGGLIFFQEYGSLRTIQKVCFPLAVVITFVGVVIITLGQRQKRIQTTKDFIVVRTTELLTVQDYDTPEIC